jgi:hypothetical protein
MARRSLPALLLAAGCAAPQPHGTPTPPPPAPSGAARNAPPAALSTSPRATAGEVSAQTPLPSGIAPRPPASSAHGAGPGEIHIVPLSGPSATREQACVAIALEEECAGVEVQKKIAGAPYLTVEILALSAKRRPEFKLCRTQCAVCHL